jgi:outer membrane protein insertion porin family
MDRDLQILLIVLVAVTALSVTIQMGILVALFLGVRHINRVAQNAAELIERLKPVVNEAASVSHNQLVRADRVLSDLLTRIERINDYLEQGVREIEAILAGLRSAAAAFFDRHTGSKLGRGQSEALRGWAVLFLILNLSGYFAACLGAQQPQPQVSYEGEKVAIVDLVARPYLDVAGLRSLVLQKAGEPYSNQKVQGSIAALKGTGQFSKVEVEVTPETAGLRVTFIMQPAFYIGMIDFPGALKPFSYPRLLQVVNYPAQEPYEESRVKAAEGALLRFFTDSGFFTARVQTETKLNESDQLADLVFHVTLNKRAKFGRVKVSGPPAEEAARLERAVRSYRARLKGASLNRGKPYTPERLQAAMTYIRGYLAKENRLASQVRLQPAHYDPETNRADVGFQVALGPTVRVRTVGARVWKRTLRKLVPIYEERSFDQDLVEEGERNLIAHFQNKGYFDVKVTPKVDDEPSQISLVYQINKGQKHRVMRVSIHGNRHFSDADLSDQVVVQQGRFLSRGKFNEDLLNRSVKNLTAFYQDAGFTDVKVQPEVVDREPKLYVTFGIAEGEQTLVDSLRIEGNKTQTLASLAPDGLTLKLDRPYSRTRLDRDRSQIVASYLNQGYLNMDFKSTVKPVADKPHRVAVTYVINEGPQVRVGQVAYVGSRRTRRDFLESNADIDLGAPLSEGKLLEAESTLYNLGVFDWTNVAPRKPVTDQKEEEVLVKVHEAKRNSLSWGLGFESTSRSGSLSAGIVALPGLPPLQLPPSFKVIQKNVISPLASLEFTRLNLRGHGETASIATLLSRLDQRASFTYTDPQFRGLHWSALWTVSVERTSQNPLFTARLGLASFQLERALDPAKTQRLQFRYTFQRTTLTNLLIQNLPVLPNQPHAPPFILPEDENVRSSRLSVSYVRDTRDKPLDAHKGVFQTADFAISPKVIGSSNNLARFFGQTAYYRQVKPWMVWANNVRLGMVKSLGAGSHVPLSEMYFSGGYDSLRGFPLNGAGPQTQAALCTSTTDLKTCSATISVPRGGHELFIFNSEGRFPIPLKKGLGGAIFYDGGNVYDRIGFSRFFTDYSNTVGVGLRYDTPVGPVRIDIGRNLNPVPGLKRTQIFVTLGQAF